MTELRKTPLYDWHEAQGAKLVNFGGWSMPLYYTSIVEEHHATRRAATLFDVSHMGRFRFEGPGAAVFLDHLLTRRVDRLKPGQVRYSLICNEQGGVLDDVLVYHLQDASGESYYWMVVNASNRAKIAAWIESHRGGRDVEFSDLTTATAMIAVQGPRAVGLADSLLNFDLAAAAYYTARECEVGIHEGLASRTGYTGEDGCELIVPAAAAEHVWRQLLDRGKDHRAAPAGLGARDTLRLEAGMPLYGHELSEDINAAQTDLGFAISSKDREFIGRQAIVEAKSDPALPRRVGLTLEGKRVPREGYAVLAGAETVGHVTSGTFSPTLERPIAMAYITPQAAESGGELAIDIRGRSEPARLTALPFYRRETN